MPEAFRFRNYDPATGGMRKHARTDEHDTVEKQVEGLAEEVIAQDELTRNQDLVSSHCQAGLPHPLSLAELTLLFLYRI